MKTHSPTKQRQAFVNVAMPAPLRDRLIKKVKKVGSYGSTSDYVRDLIRRDLDRDQGMAKFDRFITEGANSPTELVTPEWWQKLDAEIARRRQVRAKSPTTKHRKRA